MQKKVLLLCLLLLAAGLAQTATDLTLPEGYSASVVATGLRGPTQMVLGPDGRLRLAQLGGAENAGAGQVEAFISGLQNPQHLLLTPEGLLVSDFSSGALYLLTKP